MKTEIRVTPEEAKLTVKKRFPFEGYIDRAVDSYVSIAKTVLKHLEPSARILDFGSGPCDKTAVLQTLGFKCSACDDLQDNWHRIEGNREKIMEFARNFEIDFVLLADGRLPFEKNSFDMVMMHDVIEHLHDSPRDLLNDLLELVKPEGLLFITVPNAVNLVNRVSVLFGKTIFPRFSTYYWYPGPWRGHVREYVKDDLVRLAEYLTLNVLELRDCHQRAKAIPDVIRPFYFALSGVFTGLRDSWLLVAKKPPGWAPRKTLPEEEFVKILDFATPYTY